MRSKPVGGLIAVALVATACHTLTPLSWDQLEALRPSRIYLTQSDRSVLQLTGPRVFGDTVVGYVSGEFLELPTASVQRVAVRKLHRAKTIGLIAASTAAAAAVAVWMSGVGAYDDRILVDCTETPDDPLCQ